MFGMMGKKKGMTQIFREDGSFVPVTVVEVPPCVVAELKRQDQHGYNAVQLAFEEVKESRLSKSQLGFLKKKGLGLKRRLKEFRIEGEKSLQEGQEITVKAFRAGDMVHVRGATKGRGFQGVMKRHSHAGGPASHGSDFHRRTGSIGMRTLPSRIFKNTELPGHMGTNTVTIQNLEVVNVHADENVILIRGALPGSREGWIEVISQDPKFLEREEVAGKSEEKIEEKAS